VNPHPPPTYACDPERGCITCSDEGIVMRVVQLGADDGLAVCADEQGRQSEVMITLVEPVAPGDTLLVHAGTALVTLTPRPPLPQAEEGEASLERAVGEGKQGAV
jgi:hydrogenase maturation factor